MRKSPRLFIDGDDATIRTLNRKDRRLFRSRSSRIVKRTSKSPSEVKAAYTFGMAIANLLYPKHFPKLIASEISPEAIKLEPKKPDIVYAKRVRLTDESQKEINGWYIPSNSAHTVHRSTGLRNVKETENKIFQESGIKVNPRPMNVGISQKGDMVFFEVSYIYFPKLNKFVYEMPEDTPALKLRKKQAWELLWSLARLSQNDILWVHERSDKDRGRDL
ncbi:MAG: hypothetical protein HY544_00925 [Candidatus Diapherotrites archaeon]|uniref:Uncharacterized protein n=1 Tax=Candidatus Iainarchaeum sp. TaxID=3101447 RepID=A0A8T3YJ29_9ARCH|nr:hypothetical protein [Candidatus Diapherotrites archaeon]